MMKWGEEPKNSQREHPKTPKISGPDPETSSNCSAMSPEDQGEYKQSQSPHLPQAKGDDLAPATKHDIRQLLLEIKQMFDSDINLARTEIQAGTTRVQATEDDIMDLCQE
ncbi:Hypothetical predicted protein, partial [Pelobates cultripes]